MEKAVNLVSREGSTSVYISVKIDDVGDLVFSGQDIGDAPAEYVGNSDYEYWLTVPAHEKDRFLLLLLEKQFLNDESVMSTVREMLESKGISYSSHSF